MIDTVNETVADRIKKRMDELKIKQVDLINKNVASKGTISLWLSGGAEPTRERLVRLAEELQTTEKWILSGQGDTFGRLDNNIDLNPIATVGYAPVISWVQAGVWTGMENIELTGGEEKLPLVPGAGSRSFYLKVKGISNAPYFLDEERICIDPDICFDDIQTGEMIVVRKGNEATFKALLRSENRLYLKALNKEWQPNIMPIEEDCVYIGKYVGSFKPAERYNLT